LTAYWNNPALANGDLGDWAASGPNGFDPTGNDSFLNNSSPGVINEVSSFDIDLMNVLGWNLAPPPPTTPAGTTAGLILRNTGGSSGQLQVYDIGSNAILAGYPLGSVGLSWQVMGFGDFAGNPNESDMIMHDSNTGTLEYFDIRSSQIVSAGSMGSIGAEWQALGVGDFSGIAGEADIIIRNESKGSLYFFDIEHNQIVSVGALASIGGEWQALGVGSPLVFGSPLV
jgi:hypothetical protein